MRGAVLLLLFCVSAEGGGVDRGSQSSVLAEREIWTELRAIKNKVGEQEVELQTHRDNVSSLEKENRALVSRVSASEEQLAALRAELEVSKNELQLDETGRRSSGTKVAFSAALSPGKFGPYNTETPLVYRRSIANLGGAYSSNTGVFTAPVRGAYYFRFTAMNNKHGENMAVNLYRNSQRIIHNSKQNDGNTFLSNAAVLRLNQGDEVYMRLHEDCGLFENDDTYNTFSGFLLFSI
ncbi:complement C1q-like protein 2 [Pseudochaenichthys georgianus]|uniref:complement C1q-like protein 2 n=1 Tax=Pseudochaenichthys georgianus TaxID=52239 RepID=UPI001469AFCA|nr:complement C1q-like protein 2 [Pseudochaenichthys georgianus]XP_033964989.1 complement C1q-like protein 2 [Pseudochaenichthys georgianus]